MQRLGRSRSGASEAGSPRRARARGLALVAATGLAACGGSAEVGGAAGATSSAASVQARATDAVAPAPVGPLAFETRAFRFELVRPEDQRRLVIEADVPVPRGWAPDPHANPVQTTLLAPGGAGARVTVSATCFGTCSAAKAEANLAGAAKLLADASPGARIVRDEALAPPAGVDGVPGARMRGFVIATPELGQLVGVGLQPEVETGFIVACQAVLRDPYAGEVSAVFDACAKMQVRVIDAALPIAAERVERENLAKCPRAAQVTVSAKAAAPGAPAADILGDIQTVMAVSTRAGLVELYLGDYALTSVRADLATPGPLGPLGPVGPGQHRVRIGFDAGRLGGEVLSGILPALHGPVRIEASLATHGAVEPLASDQLEGQVELVARTRNAICGKFRLADPTRIIEGEFPVTPIRIGYAP